MCARAFLHACRGVKSLALALLIAASLCKPAMADAVRGTATLSKPGDYARLVIKLQQRVDAEVTTSGSIVIIRFREPVDVNVDKLPAGAPDYVGSARTDPDGMAVRLALARKAKPNVIAAGERLFVDLLPDNWSGQPPPLPMEVVKELADRAAAAERLLRQKEAEVVVKKRPPVRVRASVQPTFTRYIFELPEGGGVSSILDKDKLSLKFDSGISFDLTDAKVVTAPNVSSVTQKVENDTTTVDFALIGNADVHSFREEKNYIVDIGFATKPEAEPKPDPAAMTPPAVRPAASQASEVVPPAPPASKQVAVAAEPAAPVVESKPALADAPEPAAQPVTTKPIATEPVATKLATAEVRAAPPPPATLEMRPAAPAPFTGASMAVSASRSSEGLKLTVPFAAPTTGAVFVRGDTLWMVFDQPTPLNIGLLAQDGAPIVRDVMQMPLANGRALRLRLNKPQFASAQAEGTNWIVSVADVAKATPEPLATLRNIADAGKASVSIPFEKPARVHRIVDPEAGDAVLAITGALPARGFVRRQNFVEFALADSVQGVVVEPRADDVQVELAPDKITLGRPGGLTLSPAEGAAEQAAVVPKAIFDVASWQADRDSDFFARHDALWLAASQASDDARAGLHLDLARLYLAKGLYREARAAIDSLPADQVPDDAAFHIVRGLASILAGAPEAGLKDLDHPSIGAGRDARLWRAMAFARLGKWAEARELFKGAEYALAALPLDLQRMAIVDALRASLEVRDFDGVSSRFNELEIVGSIPEQEGYLALLRGRMAQALGRDKDALAFYRTASASGDRPSASEAKLYEIELARKRDEITEEQALEQLETLQAMWRGDLIEVKTLRLLATMYERAGRYRDALLTARMGTQLSPNSEPARQMQDDAAALFNDLFNGAKADEMPPVQALALFYEFRELTPIGRRGDEMIRRLAERLVAIDLLDQASELLHYQVEHRLEGAARAQVAARLAMIYLMNRKPDRALAALRATRLADVAGEIRQQRLLIEARAQSDIGRHDLALDIVANLVGRETVRLRSDIYWAGRRWRESAEQIELLYGERWKDFQPLTAAEKSDVLRAALGYSLASDAIGLARLKEKFAAKFSDDGDKPVFEAATQLSAANSAEFARIAKMAASVDTLDGFLREMRQRFPDMATRPTPVTQKADPSSTGALPAIRGLRRVEARR
ncbi:MAG: tetratricopeptide repeat protein [Xanthobacteraceae bacterium]